MVQSSILGPISGSAGKARPSGCTRAPRRRALLARARGGGGLARHCAAVPPEPARMAGRLREATDSRRGRGGSGASGPRREARASSGAATVGGLRAARFVCTAGAWGGDGRS